MILPTIMFALAVGFGSGAAVWLAIRRVMYLEQPEELWPAIQHFWSVAHASQGRVWALIPIVIAIAVALIVVTVVSDAMDQGRRNRRGSTLIGAKFLARLTRQPRRRGVQIALASVPVPSDAESTHFLMVGSTGTGKSNAQSEMLAGAMARGDRTIVVDPNGETLARYMRDGDRILNPFDARGEGWSIFNEIQGPSDYELIAKSVIPGSAGEDETWRAKARTFLADLLQELMARGDDLTASRLLWWAAEAPRDELQLLLAGTSTAALLQPDAGRLLDSVRGILAGYLRAHGRHPSGEFSIKHWLDEESGKPFAQLISAGLPTASLREVHRQRDATLTHNTQRYQDAVEDRPIARAGHPYPLTRSGPSINGAIKPDFVEHAGNLAMRRAGGGTIDRGLGVVTVNGGFADSGAFREVVGTSFAAPAVAHRAAKLLRRVPGASHNLLRALLGAHAKWPDPSVLLLNPNDNAEGRDKLTRLVGYGCINDHALEQSLDNIVSLICEEQIGNNRCQFYAIPIPDEFWEGGRRTREVTVALAYSPVVRTTRLDYRMTKLKFSLVVANNLDEVAAAFQRNRDEGISERGNNRWLSGEVRQAGTLQVSRWTFKQRPRGQLFIVVTRQDAPWSTVNDDLEPYALCVSIADWANVQSRLYAQIQTLLRARVEQRARARV